MGVLQRKKSGYLPSLDGWRAVAIAGVLMTHDRPWVVEGHSNVLFRGYGGWGVYLFFAISGVLICTRILEEERMLGQFRIGAFYVRRLFRIQPAAFCYLGAVAVLRLAGLIVEHWHYWIGAVFLYENFLFQALRPGELAAGFFTGHFWTLALEEHFYIVLSLFLFYVRRRRIVLLSALIVLILAGQKVATALGQATMDGSERRTYWQIQFLLVPALLALLLQRPAVRRLAERFLRPWVAFLVTFALMAMSHVKHWTRGTPFWTWHFIADESTVFLLASSLWVIATMLHAQSLTTRVLEWRPLRYGGRLSYSLYLWHVMFFTALSPVPVTRWPPLLFLSERPYKYVASVVMAMLSYYLVEKPMIRLGHRLAPPATPGHRDLDASTASLPVDVRGAE